MVDNKVPVAFLTVRGYSVQLTKVVPKAGGGYEFMNEDKLYTQKKSFDAFVAGSAKSVPFYESTPLDQQEKTFKRADQKK